MLKGTKQFIAGTLVGATLFGGTAAIAANSTSLDVVLRPIKYFFDGVQKSTPAGQDGFIYKGTTYVPLRFVSESLGEEVKWDGKTGSIYVGEQPGGEVIYLTDLAPLSTVAYMLRSSGEVTTNMNESFGNSYLIDYGILD
ncbi:stalk domain-containing protein, partial [Cryptosporangium minutisporangium]